MGILYIILSAALPLTAAAAPAELPKAERSARLKAPSSESGRSPLSERARNLGILIGRFPPGPYDAITDVKGVKVGHLTLSSGEGALIPGKGPVRTGVTVVVPADGDLWNSKVFAGSFVLNGNGEAAGLMWIQESGILETPIALTNTLSVGAAQQGLVEAALRAHPAIGISDDTLTPVVIECDDGSLNDIRGRHVKPEHVLEALDAASSGPVAEGAVGAGTGMSSYDFKGGIGTASRVLPKESGGYTVGILLNANHGGRASLRVKGAPVGAEIQDLMPVSHQDGSIIAVVATDAPLDSRQLSRLAKRAMLGVFRTGAVAYHGSGDLALAFSTANRVPHHPKERMLRLEVLSDFHLDDLFEAASDAAEEAVFNALLAAKTTVGRDGNTAYALPHDRLKSILRKYRVIE
ncbi:MAG: P1 family peptidase [Elusimicrobia bacterium]|nr:P1 family peptidase [Elusimicrobiota bacterium]